MKRQQCPTEENAQEVDSNTHVRAHWLYRYTGKKFWPFIQLARWDLPIGWLLLMWPCWWTCLIAANVKLHSTRVFLAPGETVEQCVAGYNIVLQALTYLFLFFVGSVAMRGAGCTWNDLVDHKIDAKVERTKIRPLPAQTVTRLQAKIFMLVQCFVGLLVLLQFNYYTILLAMSSLILVAIYPFMKRVMSWPQLVLGLAFNWGALLGWSAFFSSVNIVVILIYFGSVLWTIGYDTIYAHQDKKDDSLIGLGSTALYLGDDTAHALKFFYGGFILFVFIAFYIAQLGAFSYIGLLAAAVSLIWQIYNFQIDEKDTKQYAKLFRSNAWTGACLALGIFLDLLFYFFTYL